MINRDEIIKLAREADLWLTSDERIAAVERFAALVAAAERQPLTAKVIQELAEEGVFHANIFEIVRRIEEEHGIFKLRAGIGGEA